MTPKQLQDARLTMARDVVRRQNRMLNGEDFINAVAIEYARLEREGWTPEVDEAEAISAGFLNYVCATEWSLEKHRTKGAEGGRFKRAVELMTEILDKARADGDADLRARLERAEKLVDRIGYVIGNYGSGTSMGTEIKAILAERDAPEMSGYADGQPTSRPDQA
jgi:hypothetical protein